MIHDDGELIERTLEGDEHAFAALVEKYQDQIHTLVWQKIGDFHFAQEITQDVFISAYQKLATLKHRNRFSGWLYVIANRECITWYRKKKPQSQSLEETDPMELEEAYYSEHVSREREEATNEKRRAIVQKLLSKLRESDKTVITLHYLAGLSCEEISKFLGVSTNTIKSRLHRARNRLKKEESMIQEILSGFQFPTQLTENIMREISRLGPVTPSGGSPLAPLAITVAASVSAVILIGIGMQYYFGFSKTDSVKPPSANGDIQLMRTFGPQEYTRWGLPDGAIVRLGKGSVNEIKYSPSGKLFAVASNAGIWLYDAETTQELALMGGTSEVFSIAFSPDGKTLASGANGESAILWDLETHTVKSKLSVQEESNPVHSIVFSPDGRMLATGERDGVRLWDIDTGELKATLQENNERAESVAFSPDGRTVVSGNFDKTVHLWDVSTASLTATFTGHTQQVTSVAFSLDGETVASGSWDRTVRLWDVDTGTQKAILNGHKFPVASVSFSPDGKTLASGSVDKTIRLWEWDAQRDVGLVSLDLQKTPFATLQGHTFPVVSVAFSPDGKTLTSAANDATIRVWDIANGEHINIIPGHLFNITSVVFSPDGKTVSSSSDTTVRLWDVGTAAFKSTFVGHTGAVFSAVFSPDGERVASGSADHTIRLWDIATGKQKDVFTGHTDFVNSVIFSPNGSMLASGSADNTVRMWDVPTGTLKTTLTGHTDRVLSVSFSPDGSMLASGSADTTIRLWNIDTGNHKAVLKGHTRDVNSVMFSPDGATLASGSDDETARLWDVATGKQKESFKGSIWVESVSFSPDGRTLAVGSWSQIDLWNVFMSTHIATIKGHRQVVNSVMFSPNGQILASGGLDGVLYLWDLKAFVKPKE